MKPKDGPIRAIGQRSITSSFVSPSSSNRWNEISTLDSDAAGELKKDGAVSSSKLSLSDFLNKKLHKTAVVRSRSLKGKSQPFLSPLGRITESSVSGGSKDDKEERNSSVVVEDEVVFQLFKKPAVGEKGNDAADSSSRFGTIGKPTDSSNSTGLSSSEPDCSPITGLQTCEHIKHATAVPKLPLVLGDDQHGRNMAAEDRLNNKKKRKKVYNHYANGSGWWDCDMEGVDSEEVGFGEIWEGVGSTTFGGIDWH